MNDRKVLIIVGTGRDFLAYQTIKASDKIFVVTDVTRTEDLNEFGREQERIRVVVEPKERQVLEPFVPLDKPEKPWLHRNRRNFKRNNRRNR